jgi:hypothetical protein
MMIFTGVMLCAGPDTVEYIWRETRSKLVQFIETSSSSSGDDSGSDPLLSANDASKQSREWLDFQSLLVSLLRSTFTASAARAVLFQAMLLAISPTPGGQEEQEGQGQGQGQGGGGGEELSVLDVWLLLALADTPQYKTKIHTCLIKQV